MRLLPLLGLAAGLAAPAAAADLAQSWPTYRHDHARSGRVDAPLEAARLEEAWAWRSAHRPQPAWPDPARWDAFAGLRGLRSMREYDPVFHPVAAEGRSWFGSSADQCVRAVDLATGEVVWTFVADGPVRVAPELSEGRLYFGADDGSAYCVDAHTGELVWRTNPTAGSRLVLHEGRLVSQWPVRSGVLVREGTAYFAASLFPWQSSFLCAVDAQTGESVGGGRYRNDLGIGWSLEGPLLAGATSLVAPQGRIEPLLFDREKGRPRGKFEGGGGSFVLLTEDEQLLVGPGNKDGWITASKSTTREKIASYQKGNAIVVDGGDAWLLSDRALMRMDRASESPLWTVPCDAPLALIKVGDVLVAGGDGHAAAWNAHDGELLWRAPVAGRAYGLAFADGHLLVATDEGVLHAFREGREARAIAAAGPEAHGDRLLPAPPLEAIAAGGLLDRWVFQDDTVRNVQLAADDPRTTPVVANQVDERPPARVAGPLQLEQAGGSHALVLDGRRNDVVVAESFGDWELPDEAITVEAWVRLDAGSAWGGIASVTQDNGDYERGWILGYRDRRFGFALAGEEGSGRLTWLTASEEFTLGRWYHVAGSFDGAEMILYVDGQPVARSEKERGAIRYPERAGYYLCAYRDDDEHFRMAGALQELRIWDRALSADAIAETWSSRAGSLPEAPPEEPPPAPLDLAAGPFLRFVAPGVAELVFETREAVAATVEWARAVEGSKGAEFGDEITSRTTRIGRNHALRVEGLRPRTLHLYRISVGAGTALRRTPDFELDTHFDVAYPGTGAAPGGAELRALAARVTTGSEGARGGVAVVLGAGRDGLVHEILRSRQWRVVVLDEASPAVEETRAAWAAAGLLGPRLSVLPLESCTDLPAAFANAVVWDPASQLSAETAARVALRLVRPFGGTAWLGARPPAAAASRDFEVDEVVLDDGASWIRARRGALAGAGAWTHQYGSADNSAFSRESLAGATTTDALAVQWYGQPGGRHQTDRQNRKPAPLSADGLLFVQGKNRVLALDAFNGSVLWGLELPPLQRFNMPRDCGNWISIGGDALLLAMGDRAWHVSTDRGRIDGAIELPVELSRREGQDWGYLAAESDRLVGSTVRRGTHFTDWWGSNKWFDARGGEVVKKVCSDALFAYSLAEVLAGATEKEKAKQPRLAWLREEGLIVNPTITIADDRVFFLEARDPELLAGEARRIEDPRLWSDLHLVALELETGEVAWERRAQPMPGEVVVYLAASEGKLVLVTSAKGAIAVYAFDAASGDSVWRRKFDWEVDHHGKAISRPAIASGRVFLRPMVLSLETGAPLVNGFPPGHQCGTYVCTEDAVVLRAGGLAVWDVEENTASRWTRLRPDCWISTIPASGMLLSPEGGGGCSCGSWIQTSVGFLPSSVE